MTLKPGTRLGPYEVVALLGQGGMGEVYLARDPRLDRQVAVKVLAEPSSANDELERRLQLEAKTIAQLQHPNICSLFDIGCEQGTDYLVMEYLEGETLEERIARGQLSIDESLQIGTEIAEAVDAAHCRQITHRDLKPGNVMLSSSGVKVLDFGLASRYSATFTAAQQLDSEAATLGTLTKEGRIVGTLPYMAPEQVEGRPTDARTDIWAFGCMLYEMVTGERALPLGHANGLDCEHSERSTRKSRSALALGTGAARPSHRTLPREESGTPLAVGPRHLPRARSAQNDSL